MNVIDFQGITSAVTRSQEYILKCKYLILIYHTNQKFKAKSESKQLIITL